jgi:zinc/manganese transport system permease protein
MFAPYMLDAWITATLVALAAGCTGYFVVLRRAGFAAHALPMAAFPGAALAGLLGIARFYGLALFALGGAAALAWLHRRQRPDAAAALVLAALLGLGALFLSLSGHYGNAVYALLFGQILGAGAADLPPACAVGLGVPAVLLLAFRPLTYSALAPDLAAARGLSGAGLDLLFLTLLAVTAAVALPIAGVLLVFTLMVGPAAAAHNLSRAPLPALVLSMGLAVGMSWAALALAYLTGLPSGFFVGTVAAAGYLAARGWRRRCG